MLIGIMGKEEKGRKVFTKLLNEQGKYEIINVHEIYLEMRKNKEIVKEIQNKLNYSENNKINFDVVLYTDSKKREVYNTIIWNYLEKIIDKRIEKATKTVIIEWDKLPLTKFYDICDIKILVDCDRNLRNSLGNSINLDSKLFRSGKKENNSIDYRKEAMNHMFYNCLTDFHINYNDADMDYIIDDNYFKNKLNATKVKTIRKKLN